MKRRYWSLLLIAAAMVVSGCGLGGGVYNLPLPGGADVGSNPLTVSVDFDDVVDLVPQSSVKVSNIAVGRVSKIDLNPDGLSAKVTLVIRNDLNLPANTAARLEQSSLLGEKYVALIRPATPAAELLEDGAHIDINETSQVAEVEQVLGAVSTILNGGGIGQFQEISRELQQISEGRPEQIRDFLRTTGTFVAGLEERKDAIAAALDSLRDLSTTLEADQSKITTALDGLSPGMAVLVEQRGELVAMLDALDKLGAVTTRTLNAAQKDMVEDFRLMEPILKNLAAAGSALPQSLQALFTYPFPDAVLGAIKGDYINTFVITNYSSLPSDCAQMGCPWPQPGYAISSNAKMAHSFSPNQVEEPKAGGGKTAKAGAKGPSPLMLPPTDSVVPGIAEPTLQVPKTPPADAATDPEADTNDGEDDRGADGKGGSQAGAGADGSGSGSGDGSQGSETEPSTSKGSSSTGSGHGAGSSNKSESGTGGAKADSGTPSSSQPGAPPSGGTGSQPERSAPQRPQQPPATTPTTPREK